ncbi:hypothetical protein SRHO_G00201510 [Serrasalmus rhombeus]
MYKSPNCHLQKFSDDSTIVGRITNEDNGENRELIQDFVDWCLRNHLQINAGKTKELVVDFRRRTHPPPAVNIQGTDIERVDAYRYLGVNLNYKLDRSDNTAALYRRGQSRLYLLRRLRSFGMQGPLLRTFFDTVVASAILYGVVCWGGSISTADRKKKGVQPFTSKVYLIKWLTSFNFICSVKHTCSSSCYDRGPFTFGFIEERNKTEYFRKILIGW